MPAATENPVEPQNADQKMWNALKRYILRERQRKKQELEAEVEEERLRKEREAREKQDVMTLEETKEQIDQLESKLKALEKEKQQLFMQLKKVLNEDETRKRQQQKESNEASQVKMQQMQSHMQQQMAMFPAGQDAPGRPPPLSSHLGNKPQMSRGPVQPGVKRQRSPSPTYALYAHRMHQPPVKQHNVYSDHKMEDGRMGRQMARAVLWNKRAQPSTHERAQYSQNVAPSSSYYGGSERAHPPPLLYAHHGHHAPMMYGQQQQQPLYLDMMKSQHQEVKKEPQAPQVIIGLSEPHNMPAVSRHLSIHPSQHSAIQAPKQGSITQGYPVQQSNPNVQNPNIYPNRHRY